MHEYFEQLVRGGIAPRRARRLLAEFEAHRADIVQERLDLGEGEQQAQATATERLGPAQDFVARSLARPELKSFSARKPWAAFAVAPIFAFAALLAASVGTMYLLVALCRQFGVWNGASLASHRVAAGAALVVLWIAPWITATGVALLAAARRRPLMWPLIGIALISFLSSLLNFSISPPSAHDQGQMSGGIGISSDPAQLASIIAYTAARCAPVMVLLLWLRSRQPIARD